MYTLTQVPLTFRRSEQWPCILLTTPILDHFGGPFVGDNLVEPTGMYKSACQRHTARQPKSDSRDSLPDHTIRL
jgi:hypothetical protein